MSEVPHRESSLEDGMDDLVDYLTRSTRLTHTEARRIVEEVINFFAEQPEDYVRRRHLGLQALGLSNEQIFQRLTIELKARRFCAPCWSMRQLRRIVYG